jgi:hypothetical protein
MSYEMFGSADALMQMERERQLAAQALAGGGGGAAGAAMGAPTGMNPAGGSNLVNQQIAAAQQQQQPGMMDPRRLEQLRQGMSLMGNMRSSPQQAPAMPAANFAGTASGQVPGMPMGNIMQAMQALYGGRGGIG